MAAAAAASSSSSAAGAGSGRVPAAPASASASASAPSGNAENDSARKRRRLQLDEKCDGEDEHLSKGDLIAICHVHELRIRVEREEKHLLMSAMRVPVRTFHLPSELEFQKSLACVEAMRNMISSSRVPQKSEAQIAEYRKAEVTRAIHEQTHEMCFTSVGLIKNFTHHGKHDFHGYDLMLEHLQTTRRVTPKDVVDTLLVCQALLVEARLVSAERVKFVFYSIALELREFLTVAWSISNETELFRLLASYDYGVVAIALAAPYIRVHSKWENVNVLTFLTVVSKTWPKRDKTILDDNISGAVRDAIDRAMAAWQSPHQPWYDSLQNKVAEIETNARRFVAGTVEDCGKSASLLAGLDYKSVAAFAAHAKFINDTGVHGPLDETATRVLFDEYANALRAASASAVAAAAKTVSESKYYPFAAAFAGLSDAAAEVPRRAAAAADAASAAAAAASRQAAAAAAAAASVASASRPDSRPAAAAAASVASASRPDSRPAAAAAAAVSGRRSRIPYCGNSGFVGDEEGDRKHQTGEDDAEPGESD